MFNPISTYRIQFQKEFNFKEFQKVIPYLKNLGIKTIYASPIFNATPGSTHGYDVVDPHTINPEIGSVESLRKLSKSLKDEGLNWLQDIVPNHMAYHPQNLWLMDVLEKGPRSEYLRFFDITWTSQLYKGRIMAPFLGSTPEEAINNSELKVGFHNDQLSFIYYDNTYPLHLKSYKTILKAGKKPSEVIQQLVEQIDDVLKIEAPENYSLKLAEIKLQLNSLAKKSPTKEYIQNCFAKVNAFPDLLISISNEQLYQLCEWKETNYQINFRRFFTINGLMCLNIQEPEVFKKYHEFIKILLKEGVFQGLRVDHVDGMYDPKLYLKNLRKLTGDPTYIVVEKILEHDEDLPEQWPVQGTTGYDFLSIINNVFSNRKNMVKLTKYYHELTNDQRSIHERIYEKKSNILFNRLAGELENLTDLFFELDLSDGEPVEREYLKATVAEFLIQCPIYRFYGNKMPLDNNEKDAVRNILKKIVKGKPELKTYAGLLEKVWLLNPDRKSEDFNRRALHFYKRVMQFTGPLMAKGVEDTLMYTYSRFIGHNEVGDSPAFDGLSVDEFHVKMKQRHEKWPLSMNATSTHDTKRGEDVRMRLAVLSDIAEEWMIYVDQWRTENKALKKGNAPDNNDEYFLYQTIIGTFPMPGVEEEDFADRLEEYITKALREAKRHSNWTEPDEQYEKNVIHFAHQLLKKDSTFRKSFSTLHKKVSDLGIINSLSQVLLKFTGPGVTDLYQGCELWDLSLVDPDNRRPVDYELRQSLLEKLTESHKIEEPWPEKLWQNRYDGQIKFWLTHLLLEYRAKDPELFMEGKYVPLDVKGRHKNNVLAFARQHENKWWLTIVPLNISSLIRFSENELPHIDWKNTRVKLPKNAPEEWYDCLTGKKVNTKKSLKLKDLSGFLPLRLLKGETTVVKKRSAGILLHITSLPSQFGVGDMGPEAYHFADFLCRSGQKYWQILPLNPTSQGAGHSPYSSQSSMAGNGLLISPELLVREGLLDEKEVRAVQLPPTEEADFENAEKIRYNLLNKAFTHFMKYSDENERKSFSRFCKKEKHWLHDYALFVILKEHFNNQAWYEWPDEYKDRKKEGLKDLENSHNEKLQKVKFIQYIFAKQWQDLKQYCNTNGIQLFGDLPFYISHDSVDVWSHRNIFKVDGEGKMTGIAGVPPDYFNANGQLWGMPVFRWKRLKKQKYNWWVQRIKKNIQLYDLLRLDHFRAFSDFWDVPAGEETAINGKWKKGPGTDLFKTLKKKLGQLPFVAEDLGDINEAVYELRDAFNFPGMKVLQFAFGDDLPHSPHIPHNYTPNHIAYTGTHDNNTTVGWFLKDAGDTEHKNLEKYTGISITKKNVNEALIREIFSSVAKIAIIPMQDILGLDENSRMNMPASIEKNWLWRLAPNLLTPEIEEKLKTWMTLYNR